MRKMAAILMVISVALFLEGCVDDKGESRSRIPDCEDVPNGRSGVDCMNRPDF